MRTGVPQTCEGRRTGGRADGARSLDRAVATCLIWEVKQNINERSRIECVASWPRDLVELLHENYEVLRDYELEEQRIDKLGRSDRRLRVYRPPNAWRAQRTALISKIEEAVQHLDMIGFHCTRLEDDEVEQSSETA